MVGYAVTNGIFANGAISLMLCHGGDATRGLLEGYRAIIISLLVLCYARQVASRCSSLFFVAHCTRRNKEVEDDFGLEGG